MQIRIAQLAFGKGRHPLPVAEPYQAGMGSVGEAIPVDEEDFWTLDDVGVDGCCVVHHRVGGLLVLGVIEIIRGL